MDRQLLNRATEGTDAPTPGYMYIDIAKNASSSPVACQEIATFLTRKLANKQNANIKFKCLKVLTKTAEAVPRGQFKRAVAQDQGAVANIRLATNFRGPPDPVRGDEPYNRVRQAAKECLDTIYSDNPTQSEQSPYTGGGGMSNTYGAPPHAQQSSPYAGAGGGGMAGPGAGGGRRMEGIGNPMFSDPRLDPQPSNNLESFVKDVGESFVGMIKDPLARKADVRIGQQQRHGEMPRPGGGMPGYGGGGYGRPPPGRDQLAQQTQGQWTMASNRGPNAVAPTGHGNDNYYKSREQGNNAFSWAKEGGHHTHSGVGGSWASASPSTASQARQPSYHEQHSATPSITVNHAPSSSSVNHGSGGTAVSDGTYEKNLIEELCPPGGMKPVPPQDKLASFAKSVPNLNADLICPVLLDALEDGNPWIKRAKALCVMETCIQYGTKPDNTNPYANFFYTCREEVTPLASHPRAAIKEPARRVCALLGVDAGSAPAAAPAPPAQAAAPAPPVNLLDFDDDDNSPAAPAPSSMPPGPPPAAPPPPPAEQSSQGSSMFGGLQVKSGAAANPPPAATAPAPPPAAPTSGNLLDGLNINDSSSQTSKPTEKVTNMFDSLTVKSKDSEEENKKVDDEDLTSVAASGSAFGFINEDSTKKPDASASQAAAPDKASFDPLTNFSPNTQRQMMQMSQDQMQAMNYQQQAYYQQMMMQQQQMQMMMMMQQQQGGAMPRGGMAMPQMQMPGVGVKRGVMGPHGGQTSSGFSFLDKPTAKKDDHKFDFVMDTMKSEKSHK